MKPTPVDDLPSGYQFGDAKRKPMVVTPAMMAAIAKAPLPNFHEMWRQYNESGFRASVLMEWAGDDAERIAAVAELLWPEPTAR